VAQTACTVTAQFVLYGVISRASAYQPVGRPLTKSAGALVTRATEEFPFVM
jgi:hypothetical protein